MPLLVREALIAPRAGSVAQGHGEIARRDRSVDVFVRKVRTKLHDVSPGWIYIHTHFGIGYRFSPERPADGGR